MNRGSEKLSTAVITAISEESNTDPLQLPEKLNDAIDADSLDTLFVGRKTDGCIQFRFNGYLVTAESSGLVDVEPVD